MTAQIIDGKDCSQRLLAEVKESVATLMKSDIVPGLAVVLVGDDAASQVYVRNKLKRCEEVGICSFEHRLPADTSEDQVLTLIDMLNHDSRVNGILVQLPLPPQINEVKVIDAIAPRKDVDGFTRSNVGGLSQGQKNILAPCTPSGCMRMLREQRDDLTGLHAVVIGCSNIVGKPMAAMLLAAGCTVSIAHSKTRDTAALTRQGDIVIVAVGRSGLVKADWIKSGAIVIDVGINRIEVDGRKRLVGDVDFTAVKNIASAITPVPGGVGPMTIACLLENTIKATLLQQGDHATANPNVGG